MLDWPSPEAEIASNVLPFRRPRICAVVIRKTKAGANQYLVAAMTKKQGDLPAEIIGPLFTVSTLEAAWQAASAESRRTGFTIVDLCSPPRRGPNEPGGGSGNRVRMAA